MTTVDFIDSHTEGEPTRAIVGGFPELHGENISEKATFFGEHCSDFRTGVLLEPRGSDVLVGALILPPSEPEVLCDVIFFNNKGLLGMCGHGTIGVAETLRYRDGLKPGHYKIGTRAGVVGVELLEGHAAAVKNVPSFVFRRDVLVYGLEIPVRGDIAYGGNWFFLSESTPCAIALENHARLSDFTHRLMARLTELGITGADGAEIDHVELFGPPTRSDCQSKNFVMCPGGAFDRSPCGTGTSAKVALLAAQGKLSPGQVWNQQSIIGSKFSASYQMEGEKLIPRIQGEAFIAGEGRLLFDSGDPFRAGIVF